MSGIIGSVGAKALMRTETVKLTKATHLQAKDEDATDSADITTQVYVEKYSAVITPTAWMIANGKNAVLIVEYIIKTDPGAGTVTAKTLVDGADAVEKTLLNIAAGKQTAVHTDIVTAALAAGTPITVSLEAKNTDAGQTSVIDYCNIYLQIGTSALVTTTLYTISDVESSWFQFEYLNYHVWTSAVDVVSGYLFYNNTNAILVAGSSFLKVKHNTYTGLLNMMVVTTEIIQSLYTDNADNPAVVSDITYSRVWFE